MATVSMGKVNRSPIMKKSCWTIGFFFFTFELKARIFFSFIFLFSIFLSLFLKLPLIPSSIDLKLPPFSFLNIHDSTTATRAKSHNDWQSKGAEAEKRKNRTPIQNLERAANDIDKTKDEVQMWYLQVICEVQANGFVFYSYNSREN